MIKSMLSRRIQINGARVLIMGLAFKENCPDLRNTRVVDVVEELKEYKVDIDVYDPWVSPVEAEHEYGINPIQQPIESGYDGIIIAVAHQLFKEMGGERIRKYCKPLNVVFDLKFVVEKGVADLRL